VEQNQWQFLKAEKVPGPPQKISFICEKTLWGSKGFLRAEVFPNTLYLLLFIALGKILVFCKFLCSFRTIT
jgi:hypothetical protein